MTDGIESAEGKQKIVVELYDKFFRNAFPKMTERLGIVTDANRDVLTGSAMAGLSDEALREQARQGRALDPDALGQLTLGRRRIETG